MLSSYPTFIARRRARCPSMKPKPPRSRPVGFPTRLHRAPPSDRRSPQSRTAPRPSSSPTPTGSHRHDGDGSDRGGPWRAAPSRARWPRTSRVERGALGSAPAPPPLRPRTYSRGLPPRRRRERPRVGVGVRPRWPGCRGCAPQRPVACRRRRAVSLAAASRGRGALACDPTRALSAGFCAPRGAEGQIRYELEGTVGGEGRGESFYLSAGLASLFVCEFAFG